MRVGLPATLALRVYVAGLHGLCARLIARGGPAAGWPANEPWGERVAWAQDPEGYPLTLIESAATPD